MATLFSRILSKTPEASESLAARSTGRSGRQRRTWSGMLAKKPCLPDQPPSCYAQKNLKAGCKSVPRIDIHAFLSQPAFQLLDTFFEADCQTASADSPPPSTTPSNLTSAAAEDADSLRADLHSLQGRYYDVRQELAAAERRLSVVAGRDWDRRCQVESLQAELAETHAALAVCRAEKDTLQAVNLSLAEHQEAMQTLAGQVAASSSEAVMSLHQNLQQTQQALQVVTWKRDQLTGLCQEYQQSMDALSHHAEAQAQQLAGQCSQLLGLSAERDRLLTLAVSAADELILADGMAEPDKVKDWADGLAGHFLQTMEESQRQLGAISWEFLASPELMLDLTAALKAGMELARCQADTPEHAVSSSRVAYELRRIVRRRLGAVHEDSTVRLRRQGCKPSTLLHNRAVTRVLTALPKDGFVPTLPQLAPAWAA